MGQEIERESFDAADFERFQQRLEAETRKLAGWFQEGRFAAGPLRGGFELEAWLVDLSGRPSPVNERFLALTDPRFACNELSKYNVELNGLPVELIGPGLDWLEQELTGTWDACNDVVEKIGAHLVTVGILPSIRQEDLSLSSISPMRRYYALNEQTMLRRGGAPIGVTIDGREGVLRVQHDNIMLESAATSFQIHLQVSRTNAHRILNAAQIVSAPMVAVAANSPFFLGQMLWEETRIPLFEQAVDSRDPRKPASEAPCRVCFGSDYVGASLMECFEENLRDYPVLLPIEPADDHARIPHLRLHNGTIWRWNRPLIGFDDKGEPHLRIEHRVVPSGPTVLDMVANAAFFFGLACFFGHAEEPPEHQLPFGVARANFYEAARHGLDANVQWLDHRATGMRDLLLRQLLPAAHDGLAAVGIDRDSIDRYLDVIRRRVETGQTGSAWQRRWVERHGRDMAALTLAYHERQRRGRPVHEWDV